MPKPGPTCKTCGKTDPNLPKFAVDECESCGKAYDELIAAINFADERGICTSHVERNNGTIRTFIKRFARLTNAFSKKLANHEAACAMFVAYYNFVWRTRRKDKTHKNDTKAMPGKLRPTAAMMAKVTDHLWSFDEFYETVINYG